MGVKFWTSWGVAPTIFKITLLRWLFPKMVSNLWFFENLHGIFHIKLKAIFFNGISFENWLRFQKKIKGISFVKFYPRASLARAVFSFKTFSDCEWRSHLPSPTTSTSWKTETEGFGCEVKSEVKWSEWCLFWSLNFFIFRYVEGGVLGNNYISIKKCTTTFLWVLNFGQVGEIFKNFQNHTTTVTFFKNGLQLVIFWKK